MELLGVILGIVFGMVIGGTVIWFLLRSRVSGDQHNLTQSNQLLQSQLDESNQKTNAIRENNVELERSLATKTADLTHLENRLKEERKELEQLQKKFTMEFQNIANKLLEEKSQKFTQQNRENLDIILKPLNEKIQSFEKKVEDSHKASLMQNAALKEQLNGLKDLNQQISKEAENLTKALKGSTKTQGNWGEMILESVLEKSGLVKDREYFTQSTFTTEEGKRLQPDVVVKMPDEKNVIIDAKVSLIAYERYTSCEDKETEDRFLKEHVTSIRAHIKLLSKKNYQHEYQLNSTDFVLMFIPIESAFSLAIGKQPEIFQEAWQYNIVLVSPTTLLATLRTIATIWKQEYQTQNAMEIARQSGALYDKFAGFAEDLLKIGKKMDESKSAYKDAMNKLVDGRGNLVRRVENLRELGANSSKTLPGALLTRALDADPD